MGQSRNDSARARVAAMTASLTPALAEQIVRMGLGRDQFFLAGYVAAYHGLPEADTRNTPQDFVRGVDAGLADRANKGA